MTERLPDKVPLPRVWTAFAVAWLLVLAVVVWRLPTLGLSPARLGGSLACLALLALSYSWLTIRHAPAVADLTADTPGVRPEPVVITHTNRLDRSTVVHLHGAITRPDSDGYPTDALAPGETRVLRYDNTGRPATLWYHDHSWRGAGRNLYMGLAGLYLLKGDSDVDEQLPNGRYDVPLMLQDRSFTSDGELSYEHEGHHGAVGKVRSARSSAMPLP